MQKQISILKLCSNKKKGRSSYLKWRILNKIWIRTRMLTNRVLWWLEKLWEVELCWDWGGEGWLFVVKKMDKEEVEMGEESRAPGHRLNIIDRLTDRIIPMITLSIEISCYRMIFLLESFVIISVMSLVYIDESFSLRSSRINFNIGIILSVTLYVQLTRHRIVCLFLFLFFLLRFPQYLAIKKIRSVNIITIYYWQKNFISIFICVYQLSSSDNLLICFGSKCFDLSLLPQCLGHWIMR
jgi:hypothetical protein